MRMLLFGVGLIKLLFAVLLFSAPVYANSSFTTFESGQVRPLALSSNKKFLYAVNTPDNKLEIYKIVNNTLMHKSSITVGLEPVSVAVLNNHEVWVVNHLSDSVSVVNVASPNKPFIKRTLLVGDEPRDVVFAGNNKKRAFITTAHRGQNVPYDPQFTTPGIGRADVWIYDVSGLITLDNEPSIITLFTDTPRALAVSSDKSKVYAAGFLTGNQTTVIHENIVLLNGGLPGPVVNAEAISQPSVGLVVKYDGQNWVDGIGRQWDDHVKFSLPDKDVFVIDADAETPHQVINGVSEYSGVGTIIYNLAVNPVTGKVYASNTEALNENRFAGEGVFAGQTVRGHFSENRISVLDASGNVDVRHLNKHIDYSQCCAPVPNAENTNSLALPTGMEVSSDGQTLYVAALGSSKVGVFSTTALENDTFVPDVNNQIALSGGGPTGLVLDESRNQMYVLTRFNNAISIVDTTTNQEVGSVPMFNPEPASVVDGRPFMYDATLSSHGDSACASCHAFGDFDGLAWDLGEPDSLTLPNLNAFVITPFGLEARPENVGFPDFKPFSDFFATNKGPMITQSLRGVANHGPMHWRGDRTASVNEPNAQPDSGSFNENAAFNQFNAAFVGLLGRDQQLPAEDMQAFTDFVLQISYPPNPVRNLDNSLTAFQQEGHDNYFGRITDTFLDCNGCHTLDREGNASFGVDKPGFFGSSGLTTFDGPSQVQKVPHLRNMYQKVGMFGIPETPGFLPDLLTGNVFMGDQIKGFGFTHDGSIDTLFAFFGFLGFVERPPGALNAFDPGNPTGFEVGPTGILERQQMEAFMLAYDSNLQPITGQQVTKTVLNKNTAFFTDRINLLVERADLDECDLVAHSFLRNYLYDGGLFHPNKQTMQPLPLADVLNSHLRITFTCAPPGSGERMALDRDSDGVYDGDEV